MRREKERREIALALRVEKGRVWGGTLGSGWKFHDTTKLIVVRIQVADKSRSHTSRNGRRTTLTAMDAK